MNNGQIGKFKITVEESSIDYEWIVLIMQNSHSSIYNHPFWLNVLEKETNQKIIRLVARDNSGQLAGVLPLQFTSGVPFGFGGLPGSKRVSSLPRTPVGGLIAINNEVAQLLIQNAIKISDEYSDCRLQIKSFNDKLNEGLPELSKYFWREVYFTDIPKYPEEIRFGNSKNHAKIKWGVNKAIKNGVTVRYSNTHKDLMSWYMLYLDTMKFHATPPRSFKFFNSLWDKCKSNGLMQLVIAELKEGANQRIIAGSIFFTFNKTVVYAFNGSNRNDFELRPNDLIHWNVIHDSQKKGFDIYDWGEVTKGQEGLAAYKEKWSSRKLNMYHYYYPDLENINIEEIDSGQINGITKKLWNILPLNLTSYLGSLIFRYL